MIEQDGFVTTYDSHDRRILAEIFNAKPAESTSPTQLESFKFEADMVYELVKSMYERTKTEEFKQCFGDSMTKADVNTVTCDVRRLFNRIRVINYNVDWYEKMAKAHYDKKEVNEGPVENLLYEGEP